MTWKRTYSTFSASEAEAITGASSATQRDWRRHGFLAPLAAGRAAFEPLALAEMLAAKTLSVAGILPAVSWPLARSCGTVILARAVNSGRGVWDQLGVLNEPLVKVSGPLPHYAVTRDGKTWAWAASADELVQYIGGVSVVLDLEWLASRLVERARKPLVIIERDFTQ